jgi:hypothetical protein
VAAAAACTKRDPCSRDRWTLLPSRARSRTLQVRRPTGRALDRPEGFQMILRQNRVMSVLAATAATLAVGASPALAGENDDDGGDDDEATQVAPTQSTGSGSGAGTSVPQGGIATGAGGMAEQGADATLLGLASGALVLMATGGGLVAAARRGES